jgi:hypothetical protein
VLDSISISASSIVKIAQDTDLYLALAEIWFPCPDQLYGIYNAVCLNKHVAKKRIEWRMAISFVTLLAGVERLSEVLAHAKSPRCNSNDKEAIAYVG